MLNPILTGLARPTLRGAVAATVVALVTLACEPRQPPPSATDPAHGALTCNACHEGGIADREVAAVPRDACAASGCHDASIPGRVSLASVQFKHRSHGSTGDVALGCAGCHGHDEGEEPLTASVESCGLCHSQELDGDRAQDCRMCHELPEHVAVTAQGVEVPHGSMLWVSSSCVRCHYDVEEPPTGVRLDRCVACHQDVESVTAEGIGQDLHPDHSGMDCLSCHESTEHRILAMSSAVELRCADCHAQSHGVELDPVGGESPVCVACHADSHAEQQSFLLGLVEADAETRPSEKFMDGIVCRSCHLGTALASGERLLPDSGQAAGLLGNGASCAGCHRPEYATVLDWWRQGLAARTRKVSAYRQAATTTLTPSPGDTVDALLSEADHLLELVRRAGGQHNIELAHDLFRASLESTARAYDAAGRAAPPAPDLGRRPTMGLCSFCHYRVDDPWHFQDMSEEFHEHALNPAGR